MEVWKHLPPSRRQTTEYPSSVGRSTGTGRQSACFLLPTPFAQQARNSAVVRTGYGRQSVRTRHTVRTCRAHRTFVSTGSLVRLSTSLGQLLLDFWCRAMPLSDCGSSVVPPGAADLTRSADGAKAWLRPGTGPTVAPEN